MNTKDALFLSLEREEKSKGSCSTEWCIGVYEMKL
jgi:hypothetical protein